MESQKIDKIDKIDKIELFPFLAAFFNRSDNTYEKLTSDAKNAHLFMLKRFMSIKYATLVQFTNRLSGAIIIDTLRDIIVPVGSKKSPGWMYTKSKSAKTDEYSELTKYVPTLQKRYNIFGRDYSMLLENFESEVINELKQIKEQENIKPKKR